MITTTTPIFYDLQFVKYDGIEKTVHVCPLNLDNYRQEDIAAKVNQTVDHGYTLRDIGEAHCRNLAERFSYSSTIIHIAR